jgi:hypothetical protein
MAASLCITQERFSALFRPYALYSLSCTGSSLKGRFSRSREIVGLANSEWDDCLAVFTVPGSNMLLKIATLHRYFSILTSDGEL